MSVFKPKSLPIQSQSSLASVSKFYVSPGSERDPNWDTTLHTQ